MRHSINTASSALVLFSVSVALGACGKSEGDGGDSNDGGGATVSIGGDAAGGAPAGGAPAGGGMAEGGAGGGGPAAGGGENGSGGDQGTGGGASSDQSPVGACFAYSAASCALYYSCTLGLSFEQSLEQYCEFAGAGCPDVVFSDGATRTVEGLFACAEDFRNFSCELYLDGFLPACVTPGTRIRGEECYAPSQCESLTCSNEGNSECGTCYGIATDADDCNEEDLICPEGFRSGADGGCFEFGSQCGKVFGCPLGEFCDADTSTCHPQGAVGAGCDLLDQCLGALVCAPEGTCRSRGAEGESCGSRRDCELGLDCDGDGLCVPLPRLGQSCAETELCAPGSFCELEESMCRPMPQEGEACGPVAAAGFFVACDEGFICDAESEPPVCLVDERRTRLPGEACEDAFFCIEGLNCVCDDEECASRHCSQLLHIGGSCSGDSFSQCRECTSCVDGLCTPVESQGLFEELCGQ